MDIKSMDIKNTDMKNSEMNNSGEEKTAEVHSTISRRGFLGALGATTAGVLAAQTASAQNSFPVFQDSFGTIAPAAGDALSVGVYPPPVYNGISGQPATVTPGYAQPNILMIMVDQLRSPRWLPAGGQAAVDQLLPNIAFLREHSFNFPNYFVAATDCTPCRATLLTGLYSQQTFMFSTPSTLAAPSLQTGFPTFGAALAQQANYETCWIGKWHLSDVAAKLQPPTPGVNGPGDYGFTASSLNLPPSSSLASPNGYANEGSVGYNSSPYGSGTLSPPETITSMNPPAGNNVSDAAIANWFINKWIPNAPAAKPWFAAVSFVNPHDITAFPYSFGFNAAPNFGPPTGNSTQGYQPPPSVGFPYSSAQPDNFIPPVNTSLYPQNGALPAQWNVGDSPSNPAYGVQNSNGVWGKPGLQAYFQSYLSYTLGSVLTTNGWFTFLNYYFWMQSCVDYQIGRVLNTLAASPFASNTIVLFTADHGDYGGSHGLHTKGAALYDESMNVPLFISFPKMRPPYSQIASSIVRPYVCSSVDIFAFLYTLALGNSWWRQSSADPYNYLSGREAILDAILSTSPQQRRLSPFANSNGQGNQPFILHTSDEFSSASVSLLNPTTGKYVQTAQPSHSIAYRTVDTTVQMTVGGVTFYGGAKLGMYSFWPCATTPGSTGQQYEFYNYTAGNVGEVGNSALVSATQLDALPSSYLGAFNNVAPSELYLQLPQFSTPAQAAQTAYLTYVNSTNCSG